VSALARGAALGFSRLRSLRSLVAVVGAAVLVVLGALLERRASSLTAADRTLVGIVFAVVVPLLAWGALVRVTSARRLEDSVRELARHGADRRQASAGIVLSAATAVALASAVLAELAVFVTRFPADPRLAADLITGAWIGLLSGAAYAGWFAFGSTFGRSGWGRGGALVLDWLLGAGVGLVALPWPRAHVRNLLGAEPVLSMPQWSATAALVVLGLIYAALAVMRSPR
jgi:hypothetical protein